MTDDDAAAGGQPQQQQQQQASFFDDVVVVEDDRCNASVAPPRTNLCNLAPCPPAWSIDSWSEVAFCLLYTYAAYRSQILHCTATFRLS